MAVPSPTVAGWELALRLRQRRIQMAIEVKTITEELGFSRNYWSAIENERKILSEESLVKLMDLLEFDQDERSELLALRVAAKERGWWSRYSGLFDPELQRLYGLEAGANHIQVYQSLLLPGLLQTADYARAIMEAGLTVRQVEVDQRVEARLRRQERLRNDELRLTAIISEAALRQQVGGTAVLREQLKHLVLAIDEHPDTLDVRVYPFSAPTSDLLGSATIYLLDFDNTGLPTVVWHESVSARAVIDDRAIVRDINSTYTDALNNTLSSADSSRLIHSRIKELG